MEYKGNQEIQNPETITERFGLPNIGVKFHSARGYVFRKYRRESSLLSIFPESFLTVTPAKRSKIVGQHWLILVYYNFFFSFNRDEMFDRKRTFIQH